MGTNYYLKVDPQPACPTCGNAPQPETLHIGKSSVGWCFSLRVFDYVRSLEDWLPLINDPRNVIEDEYGRVIPPAEMLSIITERTHPNGLLRHPIDSHCIGHGPGAWDLIAGYFS